MAHFTFQLEPVLRHRKRLEHDRMRDLAEVLATKNVLESRLKALDEQIKLAVEDLRTNRLIGPLDLTFLAGHRRYELAIQRQAMDLIRQLAQVAQREQQARTALAEAAKHLKIMEKLRQRQMERWSSEQDARERADSDEVGTQLAVRELLWREDSGDGGSTADNMNR